MLSCRLSLLKAYLPKVPIFPVPQYAVGLRLVPCVHQQAGYGSLDGTFEHAICWSTTALNLPARCAVLLPALWRQLPFARAFYTLRAGILPQYAVFWCRVLLHTWAMRLFFIDPDLSLSVVGFLAGAHRQEMRLRHSFRLDSRKLLAVPWPRLLRDVRVGFGH